MPVALLSQLDGVLWINRPGYMFVIVVAGPGRAKLGLTYIYI